MADSTTDTNDTSTVRDADKRNGEPDALNEPGRETNSRGDEIGHDTATGTDPDAQFDKPGYEDKSFGQAVDQDSELVDRLEHETGDPAEAEERFEAESKGAPARERQGRPDTSG